MKRDPLARTICGVANPLTGGAGGRRLRLPAATAGLISLCLVLAPLARAAGIMSRSETRLAMPRDTKARPLEGIFIGSHRQELVTEITAIRLKSLPDEDDDRLLLIWVVTMSNSRSITQVVNLKIILRDEEGERLSSARGRLSIATRTVDKEYEVKTKVTREVWEASHELELQADWIG